MTVAVELPQLRRDQWAIASHPAKIKVLAMGRRWGKTVLGGCLALATAKDGGRVAWIVPTYKNGRAPWRFAVQACRWVTAAKRATANKSERTIEFDNGGYFGIYSADSEDSIRSEAFNLVILDEAAKMSETAWTDAIMPTLADADGDALMISTPRGLNWFHAEYQRGKDDGRHQASFHASSAANPSPQIQKAFRLAKERVPERTFKQEWMAEFLSSGAYFQGIDAACTVAEPDQPADHAGHSLYGGLDWALSNDYTVLTIACRDCGRVVAWDRFNQIDFSYQRARILDTCTRWGLSGLLPERNSIGQPNIELLRDHVAIIAGPDGQQGFLTTATSKPALIQRLASGIEHDGYRMPADYADELRQFQVTVGTSGNPKFSAPDGLHDDRVISAALAWWAITDANGWWMT